MRRKQLAVGLFLAVAVLWASGCPGSAVHKATIASRDFRLALQAFQDGEIAWHDAGKVDNALHVSIQGYIADAANVTKEVNSNLAAGNQAGALGQVQKLLNSTDNLLNEGTLHIKDKQTLADFETGIQGIKTVITNVQIYLEGGNGK